jgi:mRNA-degrading endonuclease RelE of RelBE toxin-antitoxin system
MASTENPLSFATKLVGHKEDRWRWRVGPLRVLFTVFQDELIIDVVKIGRRGKVYD